MKVSHCRGLGGLHKPKLLSAASMCVPFALTLLPLTLGCSSSSQVAPVTTHPVRGQVLVNGKPAEGAMLKFYGKAPANTPVLPHAVVGKDGSFMVSSYGENDGAPEGEYNVTVVWRVADDGTPLPEDDEANVPDRLNGRYSSATGSGLVAKVTAGDNILQPFDLR